MARSLYQVMGSCPISLRLSAEQVGWEGTFQALSELRFQAPIWENSFRSLEA